MLKERTGKFYNSEIKEEYLNSFENIATQKIAMFPLWKARNEEERLGKDLHEMTLKELEGVLRGLRCSSSKAVYNSVNKIEEYLMWCAGKGYRRTNISPFPQHDREDWGKQFIVSYMNYSFTKEQIDDMLDILVNEVDKALLLLLFEGVRGDQYSEVLNLKEEDIFEEEGQSYLRLTNLDESQRVIPISKQLHNLLVFANRQTEYINKNGESASQDSRHYWSEFAESEFIFKRIRRGRQGGRLNNFFVNRKMGLFKEVFDHPHLKATHIIASGMMHMAHEIHQKNGVFTSDDARRIADQFDTSYTTGVTEHRYRNVTIIRKVVESEEFEKLYGYKLNINF